MRSYRKVKPLAKTILRWFCVLTIVVYGFYLPAQAVAQQAQTAQMNANSAFDREMMEIMQKMDKDMKAAPMTGDPDLDFIAMMIPHHQGATDMAKIYLQYGKDPVLRQIAQNITSEQQQQIETLQNLQVALQTSRQT
jgi:uncharacterized protein (DUF305 family)